MKTRITIEHDSAESLKSHPLWDEIMKIAFEPGPVSVIEIDGSDGATEDTQR